MKIKVIKKENGNITNPGTLKIEEMENKKYEQYINNMRGQNIFYAEQEIKKMETEQEVIKFLKEYYNPESYFGKLKKAKETGKKQAYAGHTEDCNSKHEQCDIDKIIKYVFPDGSTDIERIHTY